MFHTDFLRQVEWFRNKCCYQWTQSGLDNIRKYIRRRRLGLLGHVVRLQSEVPVTSAGAYFQFVVLQVTTFYTSTWLASPTWWTPRQLATSSLNLPTSDVQNLDSTSWKAVATACGLLVIRRRRRQQCCRLWYRCTPHIGARAFSCSAPAVSNSFPEQWHLSLSLVLCDTEDVYYLLLVINIPAARCSPCDCCARPFIIIFIIIIVYYTKNTDNQRHGKTILLLLVLLLLTTTTKIITVHEKALPAYHYNYKK